MHKGLYIILFLFSFFEVGISFAQDSEQILNEKGSKLFDNEDFVSATPVYLQLLALQPRSPEYNYKYGACLLYNSSNRKTAFKYLEFATANEQVNPDAYFFMGKAFHLNYQFDKAIKFYQKYQDKGKINKSWETERQIESCRNGKLLLKNISDIVVFEKKSTLASSFYNAYDLTEIGGNIVISDVDQSKLDKRKSHRPLIYFPTNAKRVYFGSYGDSEAGGKNIYYKDKNIDGAWSKPTLVAGGINSQYDEDFPFMDEKNGYLYFSSKGHNSMGGYDIFKAKYNAETNSFGKAENLDFAISSTDDDLFYITDDLGDFAWFASSRQSKDGKIDVYKVKQERVSAPIAALKGNFHSIINPGNKKVTIEVKDLNSNKIIGTYYTDDNGDYLITFPKNGKYEYKIQVFGTLKPFTEVVTISADEQLSLFNQKITHSENDSEEVVEVIQLAKEDISDNPELLAEVMNSKAELNPNSEVLNTTKVENSAEVTAVLKQLNMEKMSVFEASNKMQELIDFQKKELTKNENLQQQAFQLITENNQKITNLQQEVKNAVAKTHGVMEDSEKKELLDQAAKDIERINQLDLSNKEILLFADSIQNSIGNLLISSQALKTLDANLKKAKAENDGETFKVISNNVSLIQQLQLQSNDLKKNTIQSEIVSLTEMETKNSAIIASYESNLKMLKQDLSNLEAKKASSKGKKQEEVQVEIDTKKNEIGLIQNEVDKLEEKNTLLNQQITAKNKQLSLVQRVDKQLPSGEKKSNASIQKELKSVDNQNFRTLKSYVVQQREKIVSEETEEIVENIDSETIENATIENEKVENEKVENIEKEVALVENENNSNETKSSVNQSNQTEKKENQVISNYKEDLAKIESNQKLNPKQKGEAILKTETELQENLKVEIQEIQKSINENPADSELEERYELLVQEKQESENRVDEQAQILIANETGEIDSQKLLSKIDSNYEKDIQKIQKSKSENKSAELIDREQKVQIKLKEQLATNQSKVNQSNNVSLLAENQVINTLIDDSKNRVEAIQSEIPVQSELENSTAYVAKESKFRDESLGENNAILTKEFKTEAELNQQQQIISNYLDVLEVNLEDLRTRIKENPSSAAETDFDWTIQELELVEEKLASISKDLSTVKSEEEKSNETAMTEEVIAEGTEIKTETEAKEKTEKVNNTSIEAEKTEEKNTNEFLVENETKNEEILNNEVETELVTEEEVKTEEVKTEIVQNEESQTIIGQEEIKTEEVKIEEVKTEIVQNEEVKTEEIKEVLNTSEVTNETKTEEENIETENKLLTENQNEELAIEEKSSLESISSIEKINQENQLAVSQLKPQATPIQKQQLADIERTNESITTEISQISKIKDEDTKQKMLSKIEQEQLISKEKIAEIERAQDYEQMVESTSNTNNLTVLELESTSKLESKLRRYRIEIGELTTEINQLETEILNSNKRKSKELIVELDQKKTLLKSTEIALIEVEEEINKRNIPIIEVINSSQALKQAITSEEENNTAQLPQYKAIQKEYKEVVDLNAQIKATKSKIEAKQNDIESSISEAQKNKEEFPKSKLDNDLIELNTLNKNLEELQQKRSSAQVSFDDNFQKIANQDFVKNLLVRGIEPIAKPEPKELAIVEFQILTPQPQAIRQSIVLNEEKPTGLIYRIQVGAFSKPINETLFNEFTPISGEKLNNGITRYMVGNFNKSATVLDALEKVRNMGYKDAFPVAYCDGERISMFEAKRLEAAGLCIAQGENQMEIKENATTKEEPVVANEEIKNTKKEEKVNTEVVVNTPIEVTSEEKVSQEVIVENTQEIKTEVKSENQIGKEVSQEITNVESSPENEKLAAYNKAPGAAVAYAVETRLGLFFTIQVGVYNKPVPASQLFNIQPLITQRLDNGQVRYSSGIFHTIPDAKPKREEAILLGISDAYITAYYQGKRITIQEAKALLAEKGETILEPIQLVENKVLTEEQLNVVETKKIEAEEIKIEKIKDKLETSNVKVQLISKKQYDAFPIDVIKRYNQKGDFYYDVKDQRVKSVIYNAANLPSIYGFKDDVDTLIVRNKTRQEIASELILKVEYNQTTLPGYVGDWLLRFGYLRELKVLENRIQMTVFGITDPIDYEFLLNDLKSLGFEPVPEIQE